MGRFRVNIKKIEDSTKNQVTFSKRKHGLLKKVNEISLLCDVPAALVAFSPSGRLIQFPKRKRIFDVIIQYIDLPLNKRNYPIEEPQALLEQLSHIQDDDTKIISVNNQIKHYEKQISIAKLELQILETKLRSFDPSLAENATMMEIQWQKTFLETIAKRITVKKSMLKAESEMRESSEVQMDISQSNIGTSSMFDVHLKSLSHGPLLQLNIINALTEADPWLHPPSNRKSSCCGLLNEAMGLPANHPQLRVVNRRILSLPAAYYPSNRNKLNSSSLRSLQPQVSAPYYGSIQDKMMSTRIRIVPTIVPNKQQLGSINNSSMQIQGQGSIVNDASPAFDPEEIIWLSDAVFNYNDNAVVPNHLKSPRIAPPPVYEPFQHGYVDLNNANDDSNLNLNMNSEVSDGSRLESQKGHNQEQHIVTNNLDSQGGTEASEPQPDTSGFQYQNFDKGMWNNEDSPWAGTSNDLLQFDGLPFEDMVGIDDIQKTAPVEEDGVHSLDDNKTDSDEEFTIPEILLDLSDLDF